MKLSRLVNKAFSYAGMKLVRLPESPVAPVGNFYSLDVDGANLPEIEIRKLLNLLNYAKSRASGYNADEFPTGYHTLRVDGQEFKGQRDPSKRFDGVLFDFAGASVLDLGCNQGGMLFSVADRIKWGVGVDFDHRMINAANRIRRHRGAENLDFYVFDLDADDLQLLRNFLRERTVDIVFLLSVCRWIRSWKQVIDLARSISGTMLFESNGSDEQQSAQEAHLRATYGAVVKIRDGSPDDSGNAPRKLFLCRSDVRVG